MPDEVTLSTVYALVESQGAKTLAEIEKLETRLNGYVETHNHKHEAERKERLSYVRWAVTTVIGAAGVMTAILLPLLRN